MELQPQPQPHWYKTRVGKTFLTIFGILFFVAVAFASLVGYYMWQLEFGDGNALVQTFGQEFTTGEGLGNNGSATSRDDINTVIRPHNPTLGETRAPVTILAFIDFECPFCQKAFPIFEQVRETYGPAVRIVFKHFPLESIHPNAKRAALASACANEQGKFWEYHNKLFLGRVFDDLSLVTYAEDVGLDVGQFSTCVEIEKYTIQINQDFADGAELGVRGTPTYFVNGFKLEGSASLESWNQIILRELSN